MSGPAYQRVLDALREHGSVVKGSGQRVQAQCPAHEDRNPSLSVTCIEGQALLYCHAGCHVDDVLAALKLTTRDLFDDPRGETTYPYDNGRTTHRNANKRFWQKGTDKPPELYRLGKVRRAVAAGETVYVVEGEKDVHTLESLGVVATTSPMGAGSWHEVDPSPLYGAHVVVVADQDAPGRAHAEAVRASLEGHATVEVVAPKVGKDASDHVAAGHGVHDFAPVVGAGAASQALTTDDDEDDNDPAARARRLFPRLDWHALWADQDEDEWLHVPLLPARRSVVIYSPPKVGKSLLALEFAVTLSRGETFLGYQIQSRVRVLYVDFENDPRGDIRSRLQAMGYSPEDLDHLDYLSFPTMAGLDTERGSLELLEAAKAYGSVVIILDTVSRAVDGEENSNDTWLGLYRHTGLKLKQAGIAMVRLDHTGKDEAKGTRGGSAKSGDVDAIWRLSRITDERLHLECTESRMPVEVKSLHVVRYQVPRLHHTVEGLSGITEYEAKVTHLIALADANGLPANAGRDAVKAFARRRGFKARTEVFADVVKRRKTVPNPRGQFGFAGPVPDLGDSGDKEPDKMPLTSEDTCPQCGRDNRGQAHWPTCPRSLLSKGGNEGTAGQPEPQPGPLRAGERTAHGSDTHDEGGLCTVCAGPVSDIRVRAGHTTCVSCSKQVARHE